MSLTSSISIQRFAPIFKSRFGISSSNISSMVSLNKRRFSTSGTSILHIFRPEDEAALKFLLYLPIKPANTSELALRTSEFSSKTKHPPLFPLKFNLTSNTASFSALPELEDELSGGARKLCDLAWAVEESTAVGISSWTEGTGRSESMGDTRPGDKIRRASIRVRPTRPSPDFELWGELGTEWVLSFERVSDLLEGRDFRLEREKFSGLEGGTLNEQHHDRRRSLGCRRDTGFRRAESSIVGVNWMVGGYGVGARVTERMSEVLNNVKSLFQEKTKDKGVLFWIFLEIVGASWSPVR